MNRPLGPRTAPANAAYRRRHAVDRDLGSEAPQRISAPIGIVAEQQAGQVGRALGHCSEDQSPVRQALAAGHRETRLDGSTQRPDPRRRDTAQR
jgi:hypothetical protein